MASVPSHIGSFICSTGLIDADAQYFLNNPLKAITQNKYLENISKEDVLKFFIESTLTLGMTVSGGGLALELMTSLGGGVIAHKATNLFLKELGFKNEAPTKDNTLENNFYNFDFSFIFIGAFALLATRFVPIKTTNPAGLIIEKARKKLQISVADLAKQVGTWQGSLRQVILGERTLTPQLAQSLEKHFFLEEGALTALATEPSRLQPLHTHWLAAQEIDALRISRGLSWEEAAEQMEVNPSHLTLVLSGHARCTPQLAEKLESYFALPRNSLIKKFSWENEPTLKAK